MSLRPNWIRPRRRTHQPNLNLSSRRRTLNVILSTPEIAGWQISLLTSRFGDFLMARGTLASYRDALAIADRLAKVTPKMPAAARSLAVLQQGRRRTDGARQSRRGPEIVPDSLVVADHLAKGDRIAGWQRDLASYVEVGDFLMAQSNLVGAEMAPGRWAGCRPLGQGRPRKCRPAARSRNEPRSRC